MYDFRHTFITTMNSNVLYVWTSLNVRIGLMNNGLRGTRIKWYDVKYTNGTASRSLQYWIRLPAAGDSVSGIPVDKDYREGMTSLSWESLAEVRATIRQSTALIVKQMLQTRARWASISRGRFKALYHRADLALREIMHACYLTREWIGAKYISMRCTRHTGRSSSRQKYYGRFSVGAETSIIACIKFLMKLLTAGFYSSCNSRAMTFLCDLIHCFIILLCYKKQRNIKLLSICINNQCLPFNKTFILIIQS